MSWPEIEIQNFAEVVTGGTPSTRKPEFWGGEIPWLGSGELNAGEVNGSKKFITEIGLASSSARIMPPHTVMIALTGATVGVIGYLNIHASANQSVTGILPTEKHVPRYLFYFLKSIRKRVINDAYGGGQPHISQGYVKKIKVPLPPLDKQKRIAEILDEADRVRKKTRALVYKYDEFSQSLFLKMFGDPLSNPKGWELRAVDDCCLVTDYVANGSFASLKANVQYNYDKDFAVLVRTTDNTKGWNGDYVYVSQASFEFLSKSRLSKGDLIIANVGDPGKCFLCPDLGQPMTLGPNSILVRSFVEELSQTYLYHLFASKSGQRMIDKICVATAQKKFNKTSFRALEIPVPDAKTLEKFGQIIETHERQIEHEKSQLSKTDALFEALLQKAFKGELT